MEPPIKPRDSDCCGSGCNPCIFDVYEEQLQKYEASKDLTTAPTQHRKNCISQTSYTAFLLTERKFHSKNTALFTFRLKETSEDVQLAYNPGQHFLLRSEDGTFTRAYTPIPPQTNRASFTTLIKLYANGRMSNRLRDLPIGAETLWRGPYGAYVPDYGSRHVLGIAQGTGIAPLYAVFCAMIGDEECEMFLEVLVCYRDSDDFLLRDELYALSSNWNFSYEVFLSCGGAPESVKYNENVNGRRLRCEDVERYFSNKDASGVQVLICGGGEFGECWSEVVGRCGVARENVYVF